MTYAVCELPVIPLRKEPSDKSEMTSQLLFGETADVLEVQEKWLMVKTHHDNYEGWVDRKQLRLSDDKPVDSYFISGQLFSQASSGEETFTVPCGAFIRGANGEKAFMLGGKTYTMPANTKVTSTLPGIARMFLHTPYLWGGRTFMGIDCSGFTQIVMRIAGKMIPRDAWQQANVGEAINFVEEAQEGDLAFFDNADGRITHVGIILAGGEIIHASGKVRIDTLDHQGIFNRDNSTYSHQLRLIRRFS